MIPKSERHLLEFDFCFSLRARAGLSSDGSGLNVRDLFIHIFKKQKQKLAIWETFQNQFERELELLLMRIIVCDFHAFAWSVFLSLRCRRISLIYLPFLF